MSTTADREHDSRRRRDDESSPAADRARPATPRAAVAVPALLAGPEGTCRAPGAVRRRHGAGEDVLGGSALPGDVDAVLRRRKGAGAPLPPRVAEELGAGFGADFSSVRVHADSEAAGVAQSLQAQAFSYGSDLYFGAGTYRPESSSGRELLAHELAHVVQAQSGSSHGGGTTTVGRADDPAEREADAMASTALRRRLAPVGEAMTGAVVGLGSLRRRVVEVVRRVWTSRGNLSDHFQKHGGEYPGLSQAEYAEVAEETKDNGEHHVTADGRHYYYNQATNDFAAFTPDGKAMTVFKPSRGGGYWRTKKQE